MDKARKLPRNLPPRWVPLGCLLAGLATGTGPVSASEAPATGYILTAKSVPGEISQYRAAIEVKGEVKLDTAGAKTSRLPLVVNGTFLYDEKLLTDQDSPRLRRAVRYYHEAKADIKIGEGVLQSSLDQDKRLIAARADKDGLLLFSPLGPLTRDELDLIEIQGQSLFWDALLPSRSVALGGTWKVDPERFALLLGWDAATQCDVTGTLTSVEQAAAAIDLAGSLTGAVNGVVAEIQLKAKCQFDLARKRVTWFAVSLKEVRAGGHAEPGFEVIARIRIVAAPVPESPSLDEKALDGLPLDPNAGATALSFQAEKSHFRLIHERHWRTIVERHNLSVFRLIDRGELIAQCNISELPAAEPGKGLTLEAFQADVQRSLGQQFQQVTEATQSTSGDGKTILRLVVSGTANEIPIQWIYYHLANDQGRRAALAFTLEAKYLERFADADRLMVETFEFTPRPETPPAELPAPPREAEKPDAQKAART